MYMVKIAKYIKQDEPFKKVDDIKCAKHSLLIFNWNFAPLIKALIDGQTCLQNILYGFERVYLLILGLAIWV